MKRAYGEKLFNTKDPELLKYLAREEFKTKARIEGIKAKFQQQVSLFDDFESNSFRKSMAKIKRD